MNFQWKEDPERLEGVKQTALRTEFRFFHLKKRICGTSCEKRFAKRLGAGADLIREQRPARLRSRDCLFTPLSADISRVSFFFPKISPSCSALKQDTHWNKNFADREKKYEIWDSAGSANKSCWFFRHLDVCACSLSFVFIRLQNIGLKPVKKSRRLDLKAQLDSAVSNSLSMKERISVNTHEIYVRGASHNPSRLTRGVWSTCNPPDNVLLNRSLTQTKTHYTIRGEPSRIASSRVLQYSAASAGMNSRDNCAFCGRIPLISCGIAENLQKREPLSLEPLT